MMKYLRKAVIHIFLILISFISFYSLAYPASSPSTSVNAFDNVLTLKQISGAEGFLLSGANATRVIYVPIPQEWNLKSVGLHFVVYSSSILGAPSTLTAYINSNPINAIRLDGHFKTNLGWDFTIPADFLIGKTVNLTFNNMIDDYGYSCYNLSSPKYWAFISGSSTITYHYVIDDYHPDLTKYPFPFIHDPAIQKDTVIMVFPEDISLADYTAAFYIAYSLEKSSTWLGVKLIAKKISELTEEDKKNNNLIFIGSQESLHLSDNNIKWPLTIATQIIDDKQKPIDQQTGVLMLAQSPWNSTKAILAVTGNSDEAVIKAADALRNPDFTTTVLFNRYALINAKNNPPMLHASWTETDFGNLNFPNQFVYGSGNNTINYDIDLPIDKVVTGLNLVIDYGVSPFISTKDNSYLILKINDISVDGINLRGTGAKAKKWKIYLDKKYLHQGMNRLSFTFNLAMQNRYCKPEDSSLIWGIIFDTSTLTINYDSSNKVVLNFKILKASAFPLTVSFPVGQSYFKSSSFAQDILDLSKAMPLVSEIDFIDNNNLTADAIKNQNLIYIGDIDSNSFMSSIIKNISFYYHENKLYIDPRLKRYLAISNELPLNINELFISPLNLERYFMLILANKNEDYQQGIDLFLDPKKSALIDGNVALSYSNGTFTSVASDKIFKTIQRKKNLQYGVFYFMLSIVFIIIISIVGLKTYRRLKKYFSPKSKVG